jgi:hypothetical protein
VSPVPPDVQVKRADQGRDYQGKPGQKVVAIGRARVDAVKDDPGGFGKVVYYTLLDGPSKGQQIYVGHAIPVVGLTKGKTIAAGQPVATLGKKGLGNASNLTGWVEVGLAKGGAPMFASPNGARPLEKLLRGAVSYTAPAATAAPDAVAQAAPAVAQAFDANITAPVSPAPPTALGTPGPDVQLPGSVDYTISPHHEVASLWDQAAQGPLVSPETMQMVRNAQLSTGV